MKIECKCDHPQQDKLHGVGVRVHNKTDKKHGNGQYDYRCTVCDTIHKR